MFSADYGQVRPDDCDIVEEEHGRRMRTLYYSNNRLIAALMLNDGDRAHFYQQALMEAWSKERFQAELPLSKG